MQQYSPPPPASAPSWRPDRARHTPSGWWPKIIPWIGPAIFTSIVILNLAAGDYRKAIGYGGVSAFIAATSW